ncbi:uncharacterized protein LOC127566166 [Drosophila albomicans]|uniref:Uncharacterized protein LOC127566166 n=1 Tax=Drosophila albomicans TaxID=7291 RepID=A0A9C6T2D6_DROAB|nr:uncharacterized protein LOC127566166 [Drosophila albomicans]
MLQQAALPYKTAMRLHELIEIDISLEFAEFHKVGRVRELDANRFGAAYKQMIDSLAVGIIDMFFSIVIAKSLQQQLIVQQTIQWLQ